MSRILHLVNMGLRYGRSKGVRAYRLEEPPLGSLAVPCHLEESASHHDHICWGFVREDIPTEESRAEINQTPVAHRKLWMRRPRQIILTGIYNQR